MRESLPHSKKDTGDVVGWCGSGQQGEGAALNTLATLSSQLRRMWPCSSFRKRLLPSQEAP